MSIDTKKVPATGEQQGLNQEYENTDKKGIIQLPNLVKDFNILTKNGSKKLSKKEQLLQAKIDPFETILTPPSILTIDGVSYGTLGNFSCVTGKSKSKKTFFLAMLMASVLDDENSFPRFKSEVPNSNVLHFDTEQSKYHTQLVAKRVVKLLDEREIASNYSCYCLRPFNPEERIALIEEAINSTENLKLVVIDGIADLIIGYNNEDEAIKVISKFMKWTAERNIHIITVVHQNKGDNNAKGHLGSLILQKAETVLSIEKDGEISTAKPTHSRGIDIEPISFTIDDHGLPKITDYIVNEVKSNNKSPFDYAREVHKGILERVFNDHEELKSSDLSRFLKHELKSHDIQIGDNAIREWKTYYEKLSMIVRDHQQAPFKLNV